MNSSELACLKLVEQGGRLYPDVGPVPGLIRRGLLSETGVGLYKLTIDGFKMLATWTPPSPFPVMENNT